MIIQTNVRIKKKYPAVPAVTASGIFIKFSRVAKCFVALWILWVVRRTMCVCVCANLYWFLRSKSINWIGVKWLGHLHRRFGNYSVLVKITRFVYSYLFECPEWPQHWAHTHTLTHSNTNKMFPTALWSFQFRKCSIFVWFHFWNCLCCQSISTQRL